MKKVISRIIKGCGYVEGYGNHPGTAMVIFLIFVGAIAGLDRGVIGACIGASLMALVFGPMYLYGAYSRGKSKQ